MKVYVVMLETLTSDVGILGPSGFPVIASIEGVFHRLADAQAVAPGRLIWRDDPTGGQRWTASAGSKTWTVTEHDLADRRA